jgi:hypothetical protein
MATIAVLLCVSFGLLFFWLLYTWVNVERGMVIHRLGDETARLASTLFFAKMTALAQLAIALLGGTWAFLTLTATIVQIKRWPAKMCFALANVSLVCSLFAYTYGYDFLVTRIFYHASFDIDAPIVSLVQMGQQLFFVHGVIDLAFMIILGRRVQ